MLVATITKVGIAYELFMVLYLSETSRLVLSISNSQNAYLDKLLILVMYIERISFDVITNLMILYG